MKVVNFVISSVNRQIVSALYINPVFYASWVFHYLSKTLSWIRTCTSSPHWTGVTHAGTMSGLNLHYHQSLCTEFTYWLIFTCFIIRNWPHKNMTSVWSCKSSVRFTAYVMSENLSGGEQDISGFCWKFIQLPVHDQDDIVEKQGYLRTKPLQCSINTVLQPLSLDWQVTRAQPSARVQRLIYCLIAWPQFQSKNGSKGCIMKVEEEEGWRSTVCLGYTAWLSALVTVWMLDNL